MQQAYSHNVHAVVHPLELWITAAYACLTTSIWQQGWCYVYRASLIKSKSPLTKQAWCLPFTNKGRVYFCSDSSLASIPWQSNCWQHNCDRIWERNHFNHHIWEWNHSNHCISTINLQNEVILGTVIAGHGRSVHEAQSCICLSINTKLPHNQSWRELRPTIYSWHGPKASFPYLICKPPMFII